MENCLRKAIGCLEISFKRYFSPKPGLYHAAGGDFLNRNKNANKKEENMNKTHWNLILAGALGGALIVGSINILTVLDNLTGVAAATLVAAIGILVMYYARYS